MLVETIHHSEATKDCFCDGKPCFEVLIRKRKRGEEVRYWCDAMRSYFDPALFDADTCPRKEIKLWKPVFNPGKRS